MRKLLLLMLIITSPLMAQSKIERKQLPSNVTIQQEKEIEFDWRKQHWFSIFTKIEGFYFPKFKSTIPLSTTGIEFFLGKGVYFYGRIDFHFELGYNSNLSYENGMGFMMGMGGYVLNNRIPETGIGWSLMLNIGATFKISLEDYSSPIGQQSYSHYADTGMEINLKGIYNFHKNMGITIGPHIAYYFSFNDEMPNFSFGIQTGLIF